MRTQCAEMLRHDAPVGDGGGYISEAGLCASSGMMVIRDGVVVDINGAGVQMLGFDDGVKVRGRHFTEFLAPHYRESMIDRDQLRRNGATVPDEYHFMGVSAGGWQIPVQVLVARVALASGPVTVVSFREAIDNLDASLQVRGRNDAVIP